MGKGTLDDKYKELLKVQKRVKRASDNQDTQPSERLLNKRGELESEISRQMVKGEVLPDKFMDYCLRNFHGGYTIEINFQNVRVPSVFDIAPRVKAFIDYIMEQGAQRILSTYGELPTQLGVISRECEFKVRQTFRNLFVPVEQLWVFDKNENKWQRGEKSYNPKEKRHEINNDLFYIHPDIFSHPGLFCGSQGMWITDHSRERYIGGSGPEETTVYIGNNQVNESLQIKRVVSIPSAQIAVAPAPMV